MQTNLESLDLFASSVSVTVHAICSIHLSFARLHAVFVADLVSSVLQSLVGAQCPPIFPLSSLAVESNVYRQLMLSSLVLDLLTLSISKQSRYKDLETSH